MVRGRVGEFVCVTLCECGVCVCVCERESERQGTTLSATGYT